MAFTKKNRRRIVVGDEAYFWYAAGADYAIELRVMADVSKGQHLRCFFRYHQDAERLPNGNTRLSNQFVVTPHIVRQVILYGLSRGWTPLSGSGVLRLGYVDDWIDLRLEGDREEPVKTAVRSDEDAL